MTILDLIPQQWFFSDLAYASYSSLGTNGDGENVLCYCMPAYNNPSPASPTDSTLASRGVAIGCERMKALNQVKLRRQNLNLIDSKPEDKFDS